MIPVAPVVHWECEGDGSRVISWSSPSMERIVTSMRVWSFKKSCCLTENLTSVTKIVSFFLKIVFLPLMILSRPEKRGCTFQCQVNRWHFFLRIRFHITGLDWLRHFHRDTSARKKKITPKCIAEFRRAKTILLSMEGKHQKENRIFVCKLEVSSSTA